MSKKLISLLGWIYIALSATLFVVITYLAGEEISILTQFIYLVWSFVLSIFPTVYIGQLLDAFKRWWRE